MKTVIIYNQLDAELCFFVFEGDLSELDGVYINDSDADEALQDQLADLIFKDDWTLEPSLDRFPVQVVKDGAQVIVCGFLP